MKTQRELNLHYWGDLHNMVEAYNKEHHGSDVKPWECVRRTSHPNSIYSERPEFNNPPEVYQFAVAILYDEQAGVHRPVFPDDYLYDVEGLRMRAIHLPPSRLINGNFWSWHKPKPKRTFEINGVELPCPVRCESLDKANFVLDGHWFYFDSCESRNKVSRAIREILYDARDKP